MGTNYYAEVNHCDGCGRPERLHIGKSSVGWKFSFAAHPDFDPPITSWVDWQKVLAEVPIVDEYDKRWTLPDLREWVEAKFSSDHCQACAAGSAWDFHDPEGHPFTAREFS